MPGFQAVTLVEMSDKQQDDLRCTFEDAERNNLLAGIRMSTRAKIELFEEMLDLAWKTGAIKKADVSVSPESLSSASAKTSSPRLWKP